MLLLPEQTDGAKACLPGSLAELCCHGDGDVVAVGVHLPRKIRPAPEHYASTRAAALLLMDINIYTVGRIFPRRRRAGGPWWAEAWADEVVCVRLFVAVCSCVDAQVHLSAPFLISHTGILMLYFHVTYKWGLLLCITCIEISLPSPAVPQVWVLHLCCGAPDNSVCSQASFSALAICWLN